MAILKKWFDDTNLTDGAKFPTALIKCAITRFNQKIKFRRDTKRRIREIAIKIVGTHILSRYCMRYVMENFLSKESRLPTPVELTN